MDPASSADDGADLLSSAMDQQRDLSKYPEDNEPDDDDQKPAAITPNSLRGSLASIHKELSILSTTNDSVDAKPVAMLKLVPIMTRMPSKRKRDHTSGAVTKRVAKGLPLVVKKNVVVEEAPVAAEKGQVDAASLKPKKPKNPFLLFVQSQRKTVLADNPDIAHTEILAILGRVWRSSTAAQRQPFMDQFEKAQEEYKAMLQSWKDLKAAKNDNVDNDEESEEGDEDVADPGKDSALLKDATARRIEVREDPKDTTAPSLGNLMSSEQERAMKRAGRMSEDGCLLPKMAPKRKADGTYCKPQGRSVQGYTWDSFRGVWKPEDEIVVSHKEVSMPVPLATKLPPAQLDDKTFQKPLGRPMKGYEWDCQSGMWMPRQQAASVEPPDSSHGRTTITSTNASGKRDYTRSSRTATSGLDAARDQLGSGARTNDGDTSKLIAAQEVSQGYECEEETKNPDEVQGDEQETGYDEDLMDEDHVTEDQGGLPGAGSVAKLQQGRTRKLPKTPAVRQDDGTFMRPRGKTPSGYFWDNLEGCWVLGSEIPSAKEEFDSEESVIRKQPKSKPLAAADGSFVRPRGKAPEGFEWDAVQGSWVLISSHSMKSHVSNSPHPLASTGRGGKPLSKQVAGKASRASAPDTAPLRKLHLSATKNPKEPPLLNEDGTFARPLGRPPTGYSWNAKNGCWVLANRKTISSPIKIFNRKKVDVSRESITEKGEERRITMSLERGRFSRPRGRKPRDQEWDLEEGCWVSSKETTWEEMLVDVDHHRPSIAKTAESEHDVIYPKKPKLRARDGSYQRPLGRGPNGFVWDASNGIWVRSGSPKPCFTMEVDDSIPTPAPAMTKRTLDRSRSSRKRVDETYVACGQCRACLTKWNCGTCLNCVQNQEGSPCVNRICVMPVVRQSLASSTGAVKLKSSRSPPGQPYSHNPTIESLSDAEEENDDTMMMTSEPTDPPRRAGLGYPAAEEPLVSGSDLIRHLRRADRSRSQAEDMEEGDAGDTTSSEPRII